MTAKLPVGPALGKNGDVSAMMIIRPVRLDDLDGLMALAESAGVGLTTLPADRGLLRARIKRSLRAFEAEVLRPAGEVYLLVMEDLLTGQVVGTSGILARVGGFEPFFSYRIKTAVRHSEQLGVHSTVRYLQLDVSHKGPSEIGTLYLRPNARGGGNGRLLSLARFMFIAGQPKRFAPRVIAEMRGVLDAAGCSPFWKSVGTHFFDMPFAEADTLSAADKSFIGDLMPKHPIYIPMLRPEVQAVVGEVHDHTRPALQLLKQEGFTFAEQVDIFDAGPMMEAEMGQVRTIHDSRVAPLVEVGPVAGARADTLISNERLDVRIGLGRVEVLADGVRLPRDVALALGIRLGDPVRYVAARKAV
jgi:arginine N-succinyltransferase